VLCRGLGLGGQGGSASGDLGHDLFGGLAPDEGLGAVAPVFGPELDAFYEGVDCRTSAMRAHFEVGMYG
jgi:hypothetical protein